MFRNRWNQKAREIVYIQIIKLFDLGGYDDWIHGTGRQARKLANPVAAPKKGISFSDRKWEDFFKKNSHAFYPSFGIVNWNCFISWLIEKESWTYD